MLCNQIILKVIIIFFKIKLINFLFFVFLDDKNLKNLK